MGNSHDSPQLSFDEGTLLLAHWPANVEPPHIDGCGWFWDSRVSAWRCDAWCYREQVAALRSSQPGLQNALSNWDRIEYPRVVLPELRSEQQAALEAWMPQRRGVVVMPTGTGKTEVALAIMQHTGVSTLVVAPVRDLMYQWHRRILQGLGYDAGIIGDQIFRVQPISVTTYDSACLHMNRLGDRFALIVFDECHHLPGPVRSDAARMSAAPFRLGLTATLQRADGRHLDLLQWIGPVVYELPLENVKGKSLADYEIVRVPVFLHDDEQRRYDELSRQIRHYMADCRQNNEQIKTWQDVCAQAAADPAARAALKALRMKQAVEDRAREKLRVLEDLFRLHAGTPMLVFAGSNAMARGVSQRFLIPCLLNHCRKRERLDILDGLAQGRYPAVVANQVLDEGVDVPAVKVGVVLGGTSSTRQARQRLGRILRRLGDARAVLYEVVCAETREVKRSRKRRDDSAFDGTRHRRL